MATQPDGDQDGGPQGNDDRIDQSTHGTSRYVDVAPSSRTALGVSRSRVTNDS